MSIITCLGLDHGIKIGEKAYTKSMDSYDIESEWFSELIALGETYVLFYNLNTCPICKRTLRAWIKLYQKYEKNSLYAIAKVDCQIFYDLCNEEVDESKMDLPVVIKYR